MVFATVAILTTIAVVQMAGQRRLLRSVAATREIVTQLRYARQLAMSQRQAFTFQYDDTNKQIVLIDNNGVGTAPLLDPAYPNNAGSSVLSTIPLATSGLNSAEMTYGIPTALPAVALGDSTTKTNLTSSKLNITFQPDGSVVNASGNPVDQALFIYNSQAPRGTASAISILGMAGRIRLWRYDKNANSYLE